MLADSHSRGDVYFLQSKANVAFIRRPQSVCAHSSRGAKTEAVSEFEEVLLALAPVVQLRVEAEREDLRDEVLRETHLHDPVTVDYGMQLRHLEAVQTTNLDL